jgi:hypothetical protein
MHMKRLALVLITVLGLPLAAPAQYRLPGPPPLYGPANAPPLSPYLNLLRGRGDPAIDYFLGTIPEQQRRLNDQIFRSSILNIDQRLGIPVTPEVEEDPFRPSPGSGHPTAFGNLGGYFPAGPRPLQGGGMLPGQQIRRGR